MVFLPQSLYLFGVFYKPLLYAGFVLQTGYLFMRGIDLGRIPVVGVHDTLNFLSASLVLFSFPVRKAIRAVAGFYPMVSGAAAGFTAFSLLSPPYGMPLPPVLRTYWFELHVILSFFSYALFGIACLLGIVYRREHRGGSQPPVAVERAQYKTALIGYSLFSLSMIFGGIWAYLAWGTYWLWTPKELWTTVLWLYYSLYLHARLRGYEPPRSWAGRPSAVLGIIGFGLVLFTYLGVGLLMKSSHAF